MGRRHDHDCDDDYESGFIHTLLWPVRALWAILKGALICTIWLAITIGIITLLAKGSSEAPAQPPAAAPAPTLICK